MKCWERAIKWEKENQQKIDRARHEEGKVPMSAAVAEQRIERAQLYAVKKMRTENRMAGTLARYAVGMAELSTVRESISEMQKRDPKIVDLPQQDGQNGLWFPRVGIEVETLRKEPEGGTTWEPGRTTALEWQEGERPRVQIEHSGGARQWHDIVLEAGRGVRLRVGESKDTLVTIPNSIRDILGHGTEIKITWVNNKKVTRWHEGRIVAIDGSRWAIRYEEGGTKSVAWHDQDDLQSRGIVVMTARRRGEHTNETYQQINCNKVEGCLLLTDDGKCACVVCTEKGWPMEVIEAGEELNQGEPLQNMGPVEGRKELNRRREEKRKRERERAREINKKKKIQQHKDTQSLSRRGHVKKLAAKDSSRADAHKDSEEQTGTNGRLEPEDEGDQDTETDSHPDQEKPKDTSRKERNPTTDRNGRNADEGTDGWSTTNRRREPESGGNPG